MKIDLKKLDLVEDLVGDFDFETGVSNCDMEPGQFHLGHKTQEAITYLAKIVRTMTETKGQCANERPGFCRGYKTP